ncbi:uncharacterized protein LOC113312421 [Papaver somniferum]|uniref:uncharacterized protein LOC113312421 n=1 Tax=Papaver somniferum TaxID=3469 RepID=UPI000E6F8E90|nr:uncharacterized protein LOC113312421 [Papaver somniferum]
MSSYVNIPWVLIGDLNFTMNDYETHNSVNRPHHARHVRNFVQQLGLVDLGYSGSDTTWSNHRQGDDHVSVRLDRALVNNLRINNYTASYLQHLVLISSDHSPIMLHTIPSFNKKSPFKLYKCWFQVPSCKTTINQSWHHQFMGSSLYQFSSKLKYTRSELQRWKKLHFGNIEANLHQINSELQLCYDNNLPSTHPRTQYLTNSLQTWLAIQKEYFMQQDGDKFLEADRNTFYFHSMTNFNKRRSHIHAIQGPLGLWYDSKKDIEDIFLAHYSEITTTFVPHPHSEILQLFTPYISDSENQDLIRLPDANEIKEVVFNIRSWASPENDGFQAAFYQKCWDTIGSKIISPTQTAYVTGRHIQDNVIIAHELLHTMKSKKIKHALVGMKLDMSKAFDRVEWPFLSDILRQLGFHSDWIALIEQCVSTTDISLLINGTPSAIFQPSRGPRQGDLLSPYLFLFIMEAFSRLLQHHDDIGLLQGLKIGKHCPAINHLFFADDCLLFFQANSTQMLQLKDLQHIFGHASGHVINMQKSTIFFGKHTTHSQKISINGILNLSQMGVGKKYLGITLLLHRSRHKNSQGILNNMNIRLQGWQSKLVNHAGTTTRVNHVLSSTGMYQMQIFKLPESILHQMDKLLHNQDALWGRLLKGKYFPHNDLQFFPPPNSANASWVWESIFQGLQIILRCRVIFSSLYPNHITVIHQIIFYIAKHHLHVASSIPDIVRSVVNDTWKPPPLNVLKFNIDASYSPLSLMAGIGIIIRNDAGQYVAGKSTIRRAIDIHQAEA